PYQPGLFDLELDRQIARKGGPGLVGPVVTDRGIFIAQLLEYEPTGRGGDFEAQKRNIKRQLFQRFFMESSKENYQELTGEFRKNLDAKVNEDAVEQFSQNISEWMNNQDESEEEFSKAQQDLVLATVGGRQITGSDYLQQFRGRFRQFAPRFVKTEALKTAVDQQVDYFAWVITAEKAKIANEPDVQSELKRYEESQLMNYFNTEEVSRQSKPTEAELQNYYEDHKENFREPEKIRIWDIEVKDRDEAEKIYRKAKQGADFEELAKKYSESRALKDQGGDRGYLPEKSAYAELVKPAIKAGPDQILEPIEFKSKYHIIKTGDIKQSYLRPLSEEQVRSQVEAAVRREKEGNIRQSLLQELREENIIWINEPLLRRIS
ncbi:MAG: peptidyl-prolyl cis-trans isomerase, partial [Calditrichia bacterium]